MAPIKHIALFMSILMGLALSTFNANAQHYEPWTGAIVGATINLGNHETLTNIRRLINKGKTADAVRESDKFIRRLSLNDRSRQTTTYKYDAYNALCISLTANKEYDRAIEACNFAITHKPKRWQAINSRGSLNYKTGKFEEALTDYRDALSKAPSSGSIIRVIEHNIRISEARLPMNQ